MGGKIRVDSISRMLSLVCLLCWYQCGSLEQQRNGGRALPCEGGPYAMNAGAQNILKMKPIFTFYSSIPPQKACSEK